MNWGWVMALIQCSECGTDVSDKAAACPTCGNPIATTPLAGATASQHQVEARGPRWPLALVAVAAFIALGFVFAGKRHASPPTETAAATPETPLRADDVVRMSHDSFGCEFESKFAEAVTHYTHKEMSAWARIVNDAPWCFSGIDLKSGQTWTILQVSGSTIQIAQTTVAQYEMDPTRYKHAYWTAAFWATKVQ